MVALWTRGEPHADVPAKYDRYEGVRPSYEDQDSGDFQTRRMSDRRGVGRCESCSILISCLCAEIEVFALAAEMPGWPFSEGM